MLMQNFFAQNLQALSKSVWGSMTVTEAVKLVASEIDDIIEKLVCIYDRHEGCFDVSFGEIIKPLYNNEILWRVDYSYWKMKINSFPPMIRLYGVGLEGDCIILAWGIIKLVKSMPEECSKKMAKVSAFLNEEGIFTKQSLKDYHETT
jgi:hypothetical protein